MTTDEDIYERAGIYAANTQLKRYPTQDPCTEIKIRQIIETDYIAGVRSAVEEDKLRWVLLSERKPKRFGNYAVCNGKNKCWFEAIYSAQGSFDGWNSPKIKWWREIDLPKGL